MKTNYLKPILVAIFLGSILGCATLSAYHSIAYTPSDNPNISLLAWEYSDRRQPSFIGEKREFGDFSHGFNQIGENIKITWRNKTDQTTHTKTIPIKSALPINMHGAELRIHFNDSNKPEIYAIYHNPDQFHTIKFKGHIYSAKLVRMIYPTKKNIDITTNRIN